MSTPLERVLTFSLNTLPAASLPLELQQQIFSFLDSRSFSAARDVCRWWRFASQDAVTLKRQLQKMPMRPPVGRAQFSSQELNSMFNSSARALMLGMSVPDEWEAPGNLCTGSRLGENIRMTANRDGSRTVALDDRTVKLFDTSGSLPRLLNQRPLNDLKQTVGGGPWLKITPISCHELALSSDGRLLAVAQERTIQIYDLSDDPESFTVNEYISSAAGHFIRGLAFEKDDHVLRVELSGKGAVLYLGTPPTSQRQGKANIQHWKSPRGLKHTFLDTSLLRLKTNTHPSDRTTSVSGLQLLHAFKNGYVFAAQRHGGGDSSHYFLGHVRCSTPHNADTLVTAEPAGLTELARLEGFLSTWGTTMHGLTESGMGAWENMPSAHEHHPTYCLNGARDLLFLAERDKKRVRPRVLTQIYVYRIPSETTMAKMVEENDDGGAKGKALRKHRIARVPLSVGTISGQVVDMSSELVESDEEEGSAVSVTAITGDKTKSWRLLGC